MFQILFSRFLAYKGAITQWIKWGQNGKEAYIYKMWYIQILKINFFN